MKLLCINNKEIILYPGHNRRVICTADGLEEGKIYTTIGKPCRDEDDTLVYYIDGIGSRLCCRFTELLEESMVSKKQLEEIKLN